MEILCAWKSRGCPKEIPGYLIPAFDEGCIETEKPKDFKSGIDICGSLLNGCIRYFVKAKFPEEEAFGNRYSRQ